MEAHTVVTLLVLEIRKLQNKLLCNFQNIFVQNNIFMLIKLRLHMCSELLKLYLCSELLYLYVCSELLYLYHNR